MRLAGKVAVITGATSGIGKAMAELFACEGAAVAAVGRDLLRGQALVEQIASRGGTCTFRQAEVSSRLQVQETVNSLVQQFGRIDVLVNNAGIAPRGTVETMSEEDWDHCFAVNVKGVYLFSKYIIPLMRREQAGSIVNVASTAGVVGAWGLHAYSAAKGAVIQLTKSMAAEYGKDQIRVNALCPGGTLTPMMSALEDEDGLRRFAQLFPLKRLAEPEEIARAALFLASSEASFVTGAVLLADGGFTAI